MTTSLEEKLCIQDIQKDRLYQAIHAQDMLHELHTHNQEQVTGQVRVRDTNPHYHSTHNRNVHQRNQKVSKSKKELHKIFF